MIVIYRKQDLLLVGTVANTMTVDQEINLNVIPNFGGEKEDYSYVVTDEACFHLENIGENITVIKDEPITEMQPPTIEGRLVAVEDAITALMGV